jgi:hypothetical protein
MLNNGLILPGDLLDSVSPINWEHPLNRGLLADYAATGGGLLLKNLAGNVNGTLVNNSLWLGTSIRLNGSNYVRVENNSALNPTYITLASFVKTDAILGLPQHILCKNAASGWTSPYATYCLRFNATTNSVQGWVNNFSNNVETSIRPAANRWHHLVLTFDGSNIKIYVNGELAATRSLIGTIDSSSFPLLIGAANPSNIEGLVGELSESAIWNRAITKSEVANLYEEVLSGNPNRWNWINTRTFSIPLTTPAVAILDGPCPGTPRDSWTGNQSRSYAVTAGDVILVKLSGTDFTADVTATFTP